MLEEGHYDVVNACCWNPLSQELYSGGGDCHVMLWDAANVAAAVDQDNWSDDELMGA